jgi:hypothetical protein
MMFIYGGKAEKSDAVDGLYLIKLSLVGRRTTYGRMSGVMQPLTSTWARESKGATRRQVQATRKLKRLRIITRLNDFQTDLDHAALVIHDTLAVGASAHVFRGTDRQQPPSLSLDLYGSIVALRATATGLYEGRPVAIKQFSSWEEESFLDESQLLRYVLSSAPSSLRGAWLTGCTRHRYASIRELSHPNIVQYVGACREPHMCVVTELLPLGNLMDYLANIALVPLSWPFIMAIASGGYHLCSTSCNFACVHGSSDRPFLHRILQMSHEAWNTYTRRAFFTETSSLATS